MSCAETPDDQAAKAIADYPVFLPYSQETYDNVAGLAYDELVNVYQIADKIHNSGQAIVWSGTKELAEHYWEQLNDAGLTMAPLEQG